MWRDRVTANLLVRHIRGFPPSAQRDRMDTADTIDRRKAPSFFGVLKSGEAVHQILLQCSPGTIRNRFIVRDLSFKQTCFLLKNVPKTNLFRTLRTRITGFRGTETVHNDPSRDDQVNVLSPLSTA